MVNNLYIFGFMVHSYNEIPIKFQYCAARLRSVALVTYLYFRTSMAATEN